MRLALVHVGGPAGELDPARGGAVHWADDGDDWEARMTTAARVKAPPPYGPWAAAWAGLAVLGVLNGFGRGLYQGRIGEQRAHQVSTATLVAATVPYAMLVDRRWPTPTARVAAGTGLTWVALTTAFEFGFGRYLAKQSWRTLLADYDLRRGRMWPLALAATGAAPAAARALRLRGAREGTVVPYRAGRR
jgi:hypothetical protein